MGKIQVHIGRNPQCDYPIENPEQHRTVSGNHATLSETDRPGVFLYEDHSMNGSFINGMALHNDSCTVGINDQITLGRTYVLPLADIARRYFSTSRATVKKVTGQPLPGGVYVSPTPPMSEDASLQPWEDPPVVVEPPVAPPPIKQEESVSPERTTPTSPKCETKPGWYWAVLIGSIILGLIIGLSI